MTPLSPTVPSNISFLVVLSLESADIYVVEVSPELKAELSASEEATVLSCGVVVEVLLRPQPLSESIRTQIRSRAEVLRRTLND